MGNMLAKGETEKLMYTLAEEEVEPIAVALTDTLAEMGADTH